jgi:hypothetical protein
VSLWVISRTIVGAVQLAELVEVLPWFKAHFGTTRIMRTWANRSHTILVRRRFEEARRAVFWLLIVGAWG